jgi:cysteinyl-tRNA synthetase
MLINLLSDIDWFTVFLNLNNVDDLMQAFNDQVNRCVMLSKQYRRRRRPSASNLPHATVKLIHCQRAAWRKGKQSGNFDLYHRLRNDLRRSLNQFYSTRERSLISKGDKKQFYYSTPREVT